MLLVRGGPGASGPMKVRRERITRAWACACPAIHKPYLTRCSVCRTERPSADLFPPFPRRVSLDAA